MATGTHEFVWLHQACEAFGPKSLVDKAAREERAHRKALVVPEMPDDPAERIRLTFEAIQKVLPAKPAREALQAHVADMLYRGVLEARGIQTAPTPGIGPEPVPRHMFSDPHKIAWNGSRVKKSGRAYEDIEVRAAAAVIDPIAAVRAVARPNGRPTKQTEIHNLIDEIVAGGFDLNSINRKVACALIRAEAAKRNLNTAIGYSDPVLKRAITLKLGERR